MEVYNFADDTTFFACDEDLGFLINRLEHDSFLAIECFQNNYMKLNEDSVMYLLEGANMNISGQKLVIQELGSLINKSYLRYI